MESSQGARRDFLPSVRLGSAAKAAMIAKAGRDSGRTDQAVSVRYFFMISMSYAYRPSL